MPDRISVVVPVYNVAVDLSRCLDSILTQTHRNIEIIAVDDGSQDESGAILDEYSKKYSNFRVIHKENGGVTSARLRGIAEATGEWIGFVDGDDEIEPDMYERLLRNAEMYGAQISHCGYQMCFPDGRVHFFHNTGFLVKQDKTTGLKELLSGSIIEPGLCNKLFHKTLLHGLFNSDVMDTSIKINEDLLMNFYLFSAAETSVFDDWCPYHYIVRSSSATRAKLNENMIYDPIRVKELIRQTATEEIREAVQRAYINTCINVYHSLIISGSGYREDIRKVRNLLRLEKDSFSILGWKRELMAWLITSLPVIYKPVYTFYSRYVQTDVYS